MFIPDFFYGKFNDVDNEFKSIRKRKKTLENVQMLFDKINEGVNEKIYHDDFVIVLRDDNYICRKLFDNAYFPFIFSTYITHYEDSDSDVTNWFKEKSIECKWCQLSALATNSYVQELYYDKDYSKKLGDSICDNWDYYISIGEKFCFMPVFKKPSNKYYFWEYNTALVKLLVSITGNIYFQIDDEELENFPAIWRKYAS